MDTIPSLPPPGRDQKRFGQIDLYTYGDPEFRQVLIDSMIDNLLELQRSLCVAKEQGDLAVFHRASHKVKTTLGILDSKELSILVAEFENRIEGYERIAIFHRLCVDLIISLREEKNDCRGTNEPK